MTDKRPTHLVEQAQHGDLDAFDALVRQWRVRATALAWTRLGSEELAEDAVQDAFVDAWRWIGALREPAAFGAWFRAIVRKHVDRRTRRKDLGTVPLDEERAGQVPDEASGIAEAVRRAVRQLPAHQRAVVEPFYLHGTSTKAIAQSLGCSVAAVKKRLFDARRRLHPHLEAWMTDTLPHVVRAFAAARTGDTTHLQRALADHPELIEATDPPDEERVVSRYLPGLPSDTLLQAAVVHGHVEVVEQLIRSGAEVDTRTPGRQTPLMLAVQQSRGAIAERLIAHGADVDAVAGRGMTALHLAAKREDRPMMDLLVAAGARTDATDAHGWTAAQWLAHAEAEVRPRPTGPLRIVDPHGNALDGGPALATPARQPGTAGEPLQTGIKALDLLAPLARGRVTRVVGGPFVGKIVLLAEVMRRFAPPVIATFLDRSWTVRDFDHVLRECNVHPGARVVVGSDPSRAAELAAAALAHAEALGSIVVADDRLMHALRAASPGVPVLAFSPNAHESDPELEVDGQWVLSHELARDGRWPAVDPDRSEVAWPRRAEDASIAREARRVLAEGGPRAERLAAYLTQPFHVAYVTGIPGAVVPWSSARADVARILAGELDARPLDGLGFSGALASH